MLLAQVTKDWVILNKMLDLLGMQVQFSRRTCICFAMFRMHGKVCLHTTQSEGRRNLSIETLCRSNHSNVHCGNSWKPSES